MAEYVPTTIEGAIPNMMMAHLGELPGHSPAIPMAFPGMGFEPVAGVPYIEVSHLPNTTISPFVASSGKRLRGIHQVTVVYPTGEGVVPAYDLAGEIVTHFQKGTFIYGDVDGTRQRIQILTAPSVAPHLLDGSWVRVPVSIPFLCETKSA